MKFDPLFKSENNKLVKIEGNAVFNTEKLHLIYGENISSAELPSESSELVGIQVKWSAVELQPGVYNEEFLAVMRDYLKLLEKYGRFAFIIPQTVKQLPDTDTVQSYIDAMVHCARRIKDCTSVIGFAVPVELLEKDSDLGPNSYSQWFVNEMNVKHGHYVYFVDSAVISEKKLEQQVQSSNFILYKK